MFKQILDAYCNLLPLISSAMMTMRIYAIVLDHAVLWYINSDGSGTHSGGRLVRAMLSTCYTHQWVNHTKLRCWSSLYGILGRILFLLLMRCVQYCIAHIYLPGIHWNSQSGAPDYNLWIHLRWATALLWLYLWYSYQTLYVYFA